MAPPITRSAIIFAVLILAVSAIIIRNCNQFIYFWYIYYFSSLQLNVCQSLSQFSEEEDYDQFLDQAVLKIREIENVQGISMEEHEENS